MAPTPDPSTVVTEKGYPQRDGEDFSEGAMKDENLGVPLSPQNAEFLQKLVKVAEQTSSTTVQVTSCQGSWSGTFMFTISNTRGDVPEHFEEVEETVDCIPGDPILDLEARGYVLGQYDLYVVLNYELAKQRVKYENRNRIGRWWMRTTNDWGGFLRDLAAIVGGIWAVVDMTRMLIEALK